MRSSSMDRMDIMDGMDFMDTATKTRVPKKVYRGEKAAMVILQEVHNVH